MNAFDVVAPFVVAALAGAALAFFELLKTFQRVIGSALRSKWGLALLGVNALAAIVVYAIVRYVLKIEAGLWTAIVVGLIFPTILRSRFTFFRQAGEKTDDQLSEFSVKVDEFYRTLQDWCYTEINNLLAEQLDALADALKKRLTAKELEDKIRNRIVSGLMQDKRQEYEQHLANILEQHEDDPKRRHHALALFLIEISTPDGILKLIR